MCECQPQPQPQPPQQPKQPQPQPQPPQQPKQPLQQPQEGEGLACTHVGVDLVKSDSFYQRAVVACCCEWCAQQHTELGLVLCVYV